MTDERPSIDAADLAALEAARLSEAEAVAKLRELFVALATAKEDAA